MYYIRFTNDIEGDIERKYSRHMGGKKLPGLCAWGISDNTLSPYDSNDNIIKAARKTAEMILENTYGSYSDNSQYAVIRGRYVGSSNDGVCIEVEEVISIERF